MTSKEKRLVNQYRSFFCTQERIDVVKLIERKDMPILAHGVEALEQISCLGQFRLLKRLAEAGLLMDLSSKTEKALKVGTKIISEDALWKMIGGQA